MKIAVITGASSGLGTEFALAVDKYRPDIEEIWLIARRKDKLLSLKDQLSKNVKVVPMDITSTEKIEEYIDLLKSENAELSLLVNNAGCGKLGMFEDMPYSDNISMVRLNCEALTVMTSASLPFMKNGAEIINSCSIASFVPNTRMAVYSSTKAFVLSFSRALRSELKKRGINVLAVCPGPMDTEFLALAGIEKGTSRTFDTLPRVSPKAVAKKAIFASKKKRGVYTCLAFFKFYRFLAKILPCSLVMKLAGT